MSYLVPSELVGETVISACLARHYPARATPILFVVREFAQHHRLPAPRAIPAAVRARFLKVKRSSGGQYQTRAQRTRKQSAGGTNVPLYLSDFHEFRAFWTSEGSRYGGSSRRRQTAGCEFTDNVCRTYREGLGSGKKTRSS